ncbi:ABC transporter ATP-binding protein [Brevibacillus borstelensis]|uniref:ABC transporter ATP-binding protein n=1 Tax=Brevibacillus borstelensis TaxID=45462 RepID=UPI0030C094B0
MEAVLVQNVSKSFWAKGQSRQILANVSFQVKKGEIVSILGESGCGKSTLLNIMSGFDKPDRGTVLVDGAVVKRPGRSCVMLFQHYGLLPWRSVLKNVELGLEELPIPPKERKERASEYLKLVGLKDKAELFPHQLSGGMQQRVAIARALALQPELILMDEPFAALDTFNRYHLQNELLRIQSREKTTIILVTHDIDEAVYLSDRVLIMSANPGQFHKEIGIRTSRPRDRGHDDFQHYRKLILDEFSLRSPAPAVEFSI